MDFDSIVSGFGASIVIFVRRIFLLIMYPYKTMRSISGESDKTQIFIIFGIAYVYFKYANILRRGVVVPSILFLLFVALFLGTVFFFYVLSLFMRTSRKIAPFMYTFSYALIPTFFWFGANALLYALIPPPRTHSLPGTVLSVLFVAFSISLLVWKLILTYLAVRFSARTTFYRVVYAVILYLLVFIPVSYLMYRYRLFRIPFL